MKASFVIFIVALYFPLDAQIVFEEIVPVPGTFLRDIDESPTGLQCAVSSQAIFGKTLTGSSWMQRNQNVSSIYDVMYSPDGDLYTKNDSLILYSQNNGETFTVIDWPNGIYPPFNFTYVYVLDNDVLFINEYSGHCFYTINNGQSWHWAGQLLLSSDPVVRKVDNFIYVSDPSFTGAGIVVRINVNTGQVESVDMGSLTNQIDLIYSQISEDGTIYMFGRDYSGPNNKDLLLQYRFGYGIESLGPFPNPTDAWSFFAVGSALYNFGQNAVDVFNGIEFQPVTYAGLPEDDDKYFILSENDHVYAIVGHNRIFRSVGTLAYPGVISGTIYLDENQACIPDTSGLGLAFWNVTIEGQNFFRTGISGPEGNFRYTVPEGSYKVSAHPPATGWEQCADEINVVVDANQQEHSIAFYSKATGDCAHLSLDLSTPLLRRCVDNYYTIRVRNTGPQVSTGTTLVLHLDPFFEFHSASIPYNQIDATTVSFNLGTLEINAELKFRIFFKLSCQVALGMEHCLSGNITGDNVCPDERTTSTECQVNIGSFDPNDKRSFNEAGRVSSQVDKDEYITYHIRFQNTGTDTAFSVRIIDPLSPYLDLNTLEMLSASHPYTYEITDGPSLVVDFKNMLLPDSTTNESASHGFVKYRVKPLPSLAYGTKIPNKADIFFDFNDAVLTNETITMILPVSDVYDEHEKIDFTVFPNPAMNILELNIPEKNRGLIDNWKICDGRGSIALQDLYMQDRSLIITALSPGAYTLFLISNGNVIGAKTFVKG